MIARINPNTLAEFRDPLFPKTAVKTFIAKQLGISEESVADSLWQALAKDKQTDEHRQMIEKAISQTVNASGAIILIVNTNQGPQLIYGESQRRKKVVSSNGACEPDESIATTAIREFKEESGNPPQKGILSSIVNNEDNCQSLEITNQIGRSLEEIANRIINKKVLYINMSCLYVNTTPVNITLLKQELAELNLKLKTAAPFYQPAVLLLFGDRAKGIAPADLSDTEVLAKARELIEQFKEHCAANITENFAQHFSPDSSIKKSLEAIIDLSENSEMGTIAHEQLVSLLSLDFSDNAVVTAFRKEYFMPSFENISPHKGKRSPVHFLADIERMASQAKHINREFGAEPAKMDGDETPTVAKNPTLSSNK